MASRQPRSASPRSEDPGPGEQGAGHRRHRRRWPTPIRHDGREFLTTAQAARVLGVKPASLYAYVSRGRIQSTRIEGINGSVFALADIEAFAGRGAPRPPLGVVERIRTHITLLENDSQYYRGVDVAELAGAKAFEDVAELLWGVPAQWAVRGRRSLTERDRRAIRRLVAGARGVDVIRMVSDTLGARDPGRHETRPAQVADAAAAVIVNAVQTLPILGGAAVPSTAAAPRSPTTSSIAASLWPRLTTLPVTRPRLRLLNSALVCLADHDMSAGAVAARVAASARGGPYAVIGAGLGALDGPVHGGAATLAQEFLRSALDDPRSAVLAARADGHRVPGTGHRVYQRRDPRAEVLRSAMGQVGGGDRRVLPAIDDIADMVAEQRDFVNSDMLLAGIALRFSMVPHAAETIFAVARISGWAAHAIEEYGEAPLRFRPQGIYVGARS